MITLLVGHQPRSTGPLQQKDDDNSDCGDDDKYDNNDDENFDGDDNDDDDDEYDDGSVDNYDNDDDCMVLSNPGKGSAPPELAATTMSRWGKFTSTMMIMMVMTMVMVVMMMTI